MAPRSKQLQLTFRDDDVRWLPEETESALVAALAELLLEVEGIEHGSEDDESEDHE